MHGPHIVEDYTVTRPGGFTNRSTGRTAIALPPAVAEKMSRDPNFCSAILGYCTDRRAALEKTTVVYDPARELGIERLFPKWLFVTRDGKQNRDAISCAMPPKHILDLASAYPKGFTSTDAWRKWCDSLPQHTATQTATDALPPRIAALVLGDSEYFTTPEYRAWIGRAKQKKREEIISRELAEVYLESLNASGQAPMQSVENIAGEEVDLAASSPETTGADSVPTYAQLA
jgi:hypothetical protein